MNALLAATPLGGDAALAFTLISLVLLLVGFLIWLRGGNFETSLILLGVLICIAAVGYGALVTGEISASGRVAAGEGSVSFAAGAVSLAGTLMRVGIILVLGGIASGILVRLQPLPPQDIRNL